MRISSLLRTNRKHVVPMISLLLRGDPVADARPEAKEVSAHDPPWVRGPRQ
jgi:hypothetical protein